MKKSQALRKILRKLQEWENSRLEMKTAKELMEVIEKEIGMLPPWSSQRDFGCECGCKGRCPKGHGWDSEYLPIGSYQTERFSR